MHVTHSKVGKEYSLFGTWMFAQLDAPRPKGQYSDIQGGLGWWRDARFATETCQPCLGTV